MSDFYIRSDLFYLEQHDIWITRICRTESATVYEITASEWERYLNKRSLASLLETIQQI